MALDMFINMGPNIKGESADKVRGPEGDIDVLAWSWGMSQSGTTHMGSGGGAGKASFQDLSFTKYVDSSSNALMIALAKGSHIPEVKLLARKAGEGQKRYIEITMKEVLVTSLSTGGRNGSSSALSPPKVRISGSRAAPPPGATAARCSAPNCCAGSATTATRAATGRPRR